jgi:hypothetical protein
MQRQRGRPDRRLTRGRQSGSRLFSTRRRGRVRSMRVRAMTLVAWVSRERHTDESRSHTRDRHTPWHVQPER